ncbi:MAG: PAS domain S-box protein [Anaerolineae bacterium]|nr:PAS domain S-box protein [Anaerolineae bacterium]
MIDYQLRQREYLLEISRAMTSRLDLPSVLRLILENAAEMLRGQAGLIALRQENGSLQMRASYGLPPDLLHLFAPLLTDIPAHAEREYLIRWTIPNLQMKLSLVVSAIGLGLRQVVALPLIMEGNLIGVIYIFRSRGGAFSANDRQVLASFADQAAIAVHNARLYQQLAHEKRRLAAIIQNSADGVMILDTQRRIRVFNRALEEMTGWSAEEALGQPCSRVLALKDRQGKDICEAVCPLLQPGPEEHLYVEGDIKRPDKLLSRGVLALPAGSVVTVGITYSPLHDREGRLVSVIANVRDITRFREAEEMKSTFVSVISHELKSPVSIIKGYADTLRREDAQWDTDTLRQGLAIIAEESDRLNRLIDNLLDASRLQASAFKLELSYVQVDKLAEKVTEEFRTQASEHMFTLDFPSDFPAVQADIERLRQVLTNLLSNAIKYSPRGGLIRTGGWADDDWVYIAVADEGIGIPQSEQERIFERFYRAESPLTRRTEGAGLGLYLCKEVVEAHGGKIWVTSEPGRGAKFVFKLPRG